MLAIIRITKRSSKSTPIRFYKNSDFIKCVEELKKIQDEATDKMTHEYGWVTMSTAGTVPPGYSDMLDRQVEKGWITQEEATEMFNKTAAMDV